MDVSVAVFAFLSLLHSLIVFLNLCAFRFAEKKKTQLVATGCRL